MSEWKRYRRTNVAEMRELSEAERGGDLTAISVSAPDLALSLENRDEFNRGFIARNPQNYNDLWYVARAFFEANFEAV